MTQEQIITIQSNQIQEVTEKGVRYKDAVGNDAFIDFDNSYQELIELWNHPNVRAMNMKSRYRDEYLDLIDNLKTKKAVGFISPNGFLSLPPETGKPCISIPHVQIFFPNIKDYEILRDKILSRDVHFIIRMFEIV